MSPVSFERLTDCRCRLAENPLWHARENRLYWLDITQPRVFRYDPHSGISETILEGKTIGAMTIQADGSLLLFATLGEILHWRDGTITTLCKRLRQHRGFRFNDAIADSTGRVLSGMMAMRIKPSRMRRTIHKFVTPSKAQPSSPAELPSGFLFQLDRNIKLVRLLEGFGRPNGMGFTHDGKQLYITDSLHKIIYVCDYSLRHGTLSNRRVFARVTDTVGVPDGLTVDANGHVWSARNRGGCLVRYTPDGTEAERIALPQKNITSLTFGGPDCMDIYVTTAEQRNNSADGGIYRLQTGARGIPEHPSRINL